MPTFPPRNQPDFVENTPAETWRKIFLNNQTVPTAQKSNMLAVIPARQPPFVEDVPSEIWTEIFLNTRAVPTNHILQAQRGLSRLRRNMFSLSQICNRLRVFAVDSPCLWTWIFVDFTSDSHTPAQNLYLTRLALQRSKDSPLSIWMHNICEDDERYQASIECHYVVVKQMARWKNAFLSWTAHRFVLPQPPWFVNVDQLVEPAPLLESLVIHARVTSEPFMYDYHILPAEFWVTSPRLRRLEVRTEVVSDYPDWVFAPEVPIASWVTRNGILFDRLTHLRLSPLPCETISSDKLVLIFRSSPNLVSCSLQRFAVQISDSMEHGVYSVPVPVPLRHLRHLYLTNSSHPQLQDEVSIIRILDYISAPSLVTLTIDSEPSWEIQTLRNFTARSSCQLEELNLVGSSFRTASQAVAVMKLTPSLRAIHFGHLEMDEVFLRMWTEWDGVEGRHAVCPNLERLSVTADTLFPFVVKPAPTMTPTLMPTTRQMPGLTEILHSRLHPPNGASKTFSTLLFPSAVESWDLIWEIYALRDEPTGLKIGFNDDLLKTDGFEDELYVDR